jgi:hypothetical protein
VKVAFTGSIFKKQKPRPAKTGRGFLLSVWLRVAGGGL